MYFHLRWGEMKESGGARGAVKESVQVVRSSFIRKISDKNINAKMFYLKISGGSMLGRTMIIITGGNQGHQIRELNVPFFCEQQILFYTLFIKRGSIFQEGALDNLSCSDGHRVCLRCRDCLCVTNAS